MFPSFRFPAALLALASIAPLHAVAADPAPSPVYMGAS